MKRTTSATSRPGSEPSIDLPRIEKAVREILLAIGDDPEREGLRETPQRVARALGEFCSGSKERARRALAKQFDVASSPRVTVRGISFVSLCEHHLLPFRGRARVTYLPGKGRVVGLSKLARALGELAARPQLQERLTEEFADLIMEATSARGVEVEIEATHDCLCMRGAASAEATMLTLAMRGARQDGDPADRETSGAAMPHPCAKRTLNGQVSTPGAL